jgi:mannosyltransferase
MPSEYTNLAISIRNRIKYFGLLSDRELNLKYNNAICLIYPSQYEGFGIPVVEAMRAGCPVISINCKAVLEVGGNALELAKTGEPNEIAEAITKLADRVYRRKKSELGIIQSQKFDWEMCHKSTFEVYERLTSF